MTNSPWKWTNCGLDHGKKWLLLWIKTICEINEAKIGEKIDSNKLPSAAINLPKTKQLKYNVARYSKILPHHVLYILSKCLSTWSNNHNTSGGEPSMGIPWRGEFVSHSKSEERRTRGQDSSLINLNRICFLSQSIWYGLRMDQNTSSVQKG